MTMRGRRQSVFAALFDTHFTRPLTPALARWIYLGCMTTIGGITLFVMLLGWGMHWFLGDIGSLMVILGSPVVGIVFLMLTRVIIECVLSWFTHGRFWG